MLDDEASLVRPNNYINKLGADHNQIEAHKYNSGCRCHALPSMTANPPFSAVHKYRNSLKKIKREIENLIALGYNI